MEGEQVNHSWSMEVVSHGYGGNMDEDGGGGRYACWKKPEGFRHMS